MKNKKHKGRRKVAQLPAGDRSFRLRSTTGKVAESHSRISVLRSDAVLYPSQRSIPGWSMPARMIGANRGCSISQGIKPYAMERRASNALHR